MAIKVVVIDGRRNFLDDLSARMIIEDDLDLDIVSAITSPENLYQVINTYQPDLVAVCENVLDMEDDWHYDGTSVVTYALDLEGQKRCKQIGLPCYGIVTSTSHLLQLLHTVPDTKPETINHDKEEVVMETQVLIEEGEAQEEESEALYKNDEEVKQEKAAFTASLPMTAELNMPMYKEPPQESKKKSPFREKIENRQREEKKPHTEPNQIMQEAKEKTTVVTVYAAKGGVGKTTISTQVATYLSLLPYKRGRYNVCIVDYNIDFGDVRSTLPWDNDGDSMYEWAMDIKDRIERGEKPEEIFYSRAEMEPYLLKMNKTGLYGLCAPTRHEESMDIEYDELEIMLRNLINNGGFNFVVCDTGNNTRDSSILALLAADYILLVATQDATTAICNRSAQEALEKFGEVDMKKIKLVINNVMSARETGVSVQDIEDEFRYPCIARIKHNTDVIRSNNTSEPIVYQGNHPVTKELKNIVMMLIGKEPEVEVKQSWWNKMFKR